MADIKRANGFQTDTAMFGRDIVLIPTKPLPLGCVSRYFLPLHLLPRLLLAPSAIIIFISKRLTLPLFSHRPEYAAWAGMIVAHYGRNGGTLGGAEGHLRATSAAALSELRGYYSTSNTPTDNRTPDFSDDDDYDGVFAPRGHNRRPLPGEVELMTRQTSSQSAQGFKDDRLRRRGKSAEDDFFADELLEGEEGGSMFSSLRIPRPARIPLFRSATERLSRESQTAGNNTSNNQNTLGVGINELKDWHRKSLQWRSQLLNKIKKVASQPVMSSGGAPGSMAQAAEAALALAAGLSGGGNGGPKESRKAD